MFEIINKKNLKLPEKAKTSKPEARESENQKTV